MANRPFEYDAFCVIFLLLFGISSCGESSEKAWERQPDIVVAKTSQYPLASNYRPVLNDGFFFVVELGMEYGQPLLSIEGNSLALVECPDSPGAYDVPNLFKLYQERKEREGGHADIVLAAHPEVPMKLISFILRQFRLRGVFDFYFQVSPADGAEIEMALMQQEWGPYSADQLEFPSANPICNLSNSDPSQSSETSTSEEPNNTSPPGVSHSPFSNHKPSEWDTVANGGEGRIPQLLAYPEENDILVLSDGRTSMNQDTFSLSALGNHLRRLQELSETPVRALVTVSDQARFDKLISTMDQLIMSGLSSAVLVSEWEMSHLNELRHPRQQISPGQ